MPFFRAIDVNGAGDRLVAESKPAAQSHQPQRAGTRSSGGHGPEIVLRRSQSARDDKAALRALSQDYLEDTGNETMLGVTSPDWSELSWCEK